MVGVEQWAEVRRMHWVDGLSGREISRRTALHRDTVARLLAAGALHSWRADQRVGASDGVGAEHGPGHVAIEPAAGVPGSGAAVEAEPFKDEIYRLLADDRNLPVVRAREFIEPLSGSPRRWSHQRARDPDARGCSHRMTLQATLLPATAGPARLRESSSQE